MSIGAENEKEVSHRGQMSGQDGTQTKVCLV